MPLTHNPALSRYEIEADGHIAHIDYTRDGDVITYTHTIVPKELGGRGIGTQLVEAALTIAREAHLKVVPRCPFVAAYIEKHPEAATLA